MSATDNGQQNDQLMVAIHDSAAFIVVNGRGSFKNAPDLKRFGLSVIEMKIVRIYMDMHYCIGMDSTFMGVVAGLAVRLHDAGGGIDMLNLNARTRGLLHTLGLDQLVTPYMVNQAPEDIREKIAGIEQLMELDRKDASRRETAETMLEAHETLVEVIPDNLPKFKDVLTFLKEDLAKLNS